MGLKFKTVKAHETNFGPKKDYDKIKYIVIHYTGNKGDTALNNCKYFQGKQRGASAHYFVDGGTYIYKSAPVNRDAWAVGGKYSTQNGAGSFYKKCTNANSLSIEMCNSVESVPEKVYDQTIELVKFLMKKYGIPASRVIRHWDVNGKCCPAPWVGTGNKKWEQFKEDIVDDKKKEPPYTKIKNTSSKSKIKWLQKKLNACCTAKLEKLEVDGIWGTKTQKMLEAYWKQLGWSKGTYAGKKTCAALWQNRKK